MGLETNLPKTGQMKYTKGMYIKNLVLHSITGEIIRVPSHEKLTHLQFRRFAGCPVCNLHLQNFAKHHLKLKEAGILEIVIFHSTQKELLKYASNLPFHVIADPQKKLYKAWGVKSSLRSVLSISAIVPIFRSVGNSLLQFLRGKQPLPQLRPKGGSLGLPADFLIATDGRMVDCKYGRHADDHWSIDELLQRTNQ